MSRARRILCHFWLGCALLALVSPALAHNPDTSYTKIRITQDEVTFKITFDVITLFRITYLDANQDHQVTLEELRKESPVIETFIRKHILVDLDGTSIDFGPADPPVYSEDLKVAPEKDYHQVLVHFVFHREVLTVPEEMTIAYKVFDTLGDRHTILASVEEGDVAKEEIVFNKFEPDFDYYTALQVDMTRQLTQFAKLGVKHIFYGYDHILFLVALIVVSRFGELVKIITAFTVAHSITLILAALDFIRLPPRLVETGIAATIMYVAVENLRGKPVPHRWRLTFVFGLVHGMSFASVLQGLGLPTRGLVRSLVSFNVGVELGQLILVLALLPLALWLAKQPFDRKVKNVVSGLIFGFGLIWFVERALNVQFLSP